MNKSRQITERTRRQVPRTERDLGRGPASRAGPAVHRTWKHRFLRYGVMALVGYLGVLLVLLALENSFVYHPVRASEGWVEPPAALRHQDVQLHTADGVAIHAWWCPTENWEPSQGALLYCHGNAGNLSHRGQGLPALARATA